MTIIMPVSGSGLSGGGRYGARSDQLASCVLQLLGSAEGALEQDKAFARDLILRAKTLLELATQPALAETHSGGLRPWQTRKIEAFVCERLPDPIRTSDLSREVRMSPSHFSRVFKQSLGETPQAYVRRQRLERACRLMLVTTLSLTDIALACGYTDHAHFSRHFRSAFFRSPASWRREHGAMTVARGIGPTITLSRVPALTLSKSVPPGGLPPTSRPGAGAESG